MEYCDLNEEAEQRLEYFKERLRQRGASANTINTYARSLWLYESLYGNLSLESLNDYRNYLISHYKPSTANSRIYGMNQYLKLLESEGAEIPAGYRLAAVKLQHRPFLDNVISQRDYERLKKGLREDHDVFWYFVVHFLGSTGARISELLPDQGGTYPHGVYGPVLKGRKGPPGLFSGNAVPGRAGLAGDQRASDRLCVYQPKRRSVYRPRDQLAVEGVGQALPDRPGYRLPPLVPASVRKEFFVQI